jgi:hypothetical protein
MAVYANYEFVANTTKSEEEGGEGSYPLATEYEREKVFYNPSLHFGSASCDFLHFWKKLTGCRAIFFIGFLEVLYGIFCIFGSSSWD